MAPSSSTPAPLRKKMRAPVSLAAVPPATPAPSSPEAPPVARRVMGLPVRPRLRISYDWHGDELICEATLMDEQRQLVHRQRLLPIEGIIGQTFGFFATTLVNHLRAAGVIVTPPPGAGVVAGAPSASLRPQTTAGVLHSRRQLERLHPKAASSSAEQPASSSAEQPAPALPATVPPPAKPDDDAPPTPRG